jgi:hypothetical protein
MKHVVVIPGYANLYEFSMAHWDQIQLKFNLWQISDGVLKGAWLDGLLGRSETTPKKLAKTMDELYDRVELQRRITFVKIQLSGITSHGLLVFHMKKIPNGYKWDFVDSNRAGSTGTKIYQYGDRHFKYMESDPFIPYIEHENDLTKIFRANSKYCGRRL